MKEKFTPGPWGYDGYQVTKIRNTKRERCHGYGCGNNFICDLNDGEYHEYYNKKEQDANGHLIAVAPRMYAELADLLDAMEKGLFPQASPGVDYPSVMEKKQELRKLLKEARGEE